MSLLSKLKTCQTFIKKIHKWWLHARHDDHSIDAGEGGGARGGGGCGGEVRSFEWLEQSLDKAKGKLCCLDRLVVFLWTQPITQLGSNQLSLNLIFIIQQLDTFAARTETKPSTESLNKSYGSATGPIKIELLSQCYMPNYRDNSFCLSCADLKIQRWTDEKNFTEG